MWLPKCVPSAVLQQRRAYLTVRVGMRRQFMPAGRRLERIEDRRIFSHRLGRPRPISANTRRAGVFQAECRWRQALRRMKFQSMRSSSRPGRDRTGQEGSSLLPPDQTDEHRRAIAKATTSRHPCEKAGAPWTPRAPGRLIQIRRSPRGLRGLLVSLRDGACPVVYTNRAHAILDQSPSSIRPARRIAA